MLPMLHLLPKFLASRACSASWDNRDDSSLRLWENRASASCSSCQTCICTLKIVRLILPRSRFVLMSGSEKFSLLMKQSTSSRCSLNTHSVSCSLCNQWNRFLGSKNCQNTLWLCARIPWLAETVSDGDLEHSACGQPQLIGTLPMQKCLMQHLHSREAATRNRTKGYFSLHRLVSNPLKEHTFRPYRAPLLGKWPVFACEIVIPPNSAEWTRKTMWAGCSQDVQVVDVDSVALRWGRQVSKDDVMEWFWHSDLEPSKYWGGALCVAMCQKAKTLKKVRAEVGIYVHILSWTIRHFMGEQDPGQRSTRRRIGACARKDYHMSAPFNCIRWPGPHCKEQKQSRDREGRRHGECCGWATSCRSLARCCMKSWTLSWQLFARTWPSAALEASLAQPLVRGSAVKHEIPGSQPNLWEELRVKFQRKQNWTVEKHSIRVERWVNADQTVVRRSADDRGLTAIRRSPTAIGDEKTQPACQPRSTCRWSQIIYQGRTTEVLPSVGPPNADMVLTSSPNHGCNGPTMLQFLRLVTDSLGPRPILLLLDCALVQSGVPQQRSTSSSTSIWLIHSWRPHGHHPTWWHNQCECNRPSCGPLFPFLTLIAAQVCDSGEENVSVGVPNYSNDSGAFDPDFSCWWSCSGVTISSMGPVGA